MKYLKFVSILLSLSTYIFAFSLYTLFYKPISETNDLSENGLISPSLHYKLTGILGEISIASTCVNIFLIGVLFFFRDKKQFSMKWPSIFFLVGIFIWLYILFFDKADAFAWYVD